MCLCTYKIYILYYLDSLAFSAKRAKKLRNSFFCCGNHFLKDKKTMNFCVDILKKLLVKRKKYDYYMKIFVNNYQSIHENKFYISSRNSFTKVI